MLVCRPCRGGVSPGATCTVYEPLCVWITYQYAVLLPAHSYTMINGYECFDEATDEPMTQQELRRISSVTIKAVAPGPAAATTGIIRLSMRVRERLRTPPDVV